MAMRGETGAATNTVHYREEEISLARQLHRLIQPHWTPAAGHYVYDLHDRVERDSPFQTGVYFVINYQYFMTLLGGVEAFKDAMVWLPTWQQSRQLCRELSIADEVLIRHCFNADTIADGDELAAVYRLILSTLSTAD